MASERFFFHIVESRQSFIHDMVSEQNYTITVWVQNCFASVLWFQNKFSSTILFQNNFGYPGTILNTLPKLQVHCFVLPQDQQPTMQYMYTYLPSAECSEFLFWEHSPLAVSNACTQLLPHPGVWHTECLHNEHHVHLLTSQSGKVQIFRDNTNKSSLHSWIN
jgi:hypothetical protein